MPKKTVKNKQTSGHEIWFEIFGGIQFKKYKLISVNKFDSSKNQKKS